MEHDAVVVDQDVLMRTRRKETRINVGTCQLNGPVSSDSPYDIHPPSPTAAADPPDASATNDKNTALRNSHKAMRCW